MKTTFLLLILAIGLGLNSCKTILHYNNIQFEANNINYDSIENNSKLQILYQKDTSPYLDSLKKAYPLDDILTKGEPDQERVLKVLNWTNSRWDHVGNNTPAKSDAISILGEAEKGGRFPCFAFAIVLRDQLTVLGYRARTVYIKTKNASNSKYPPGHVVTEVYLNDIGKWGFLDGQFNVMPVLNNEPLNAIEFQKAITNKAEGLHLSGLKEPLKKEEYYSFVYPYLFYLDTSLDNRYEADTRYTVDGKKSVMLVPINAKNLDKVKFWSLDINYCIYTNSVLDFYAKPL